jgi:hypothetical protein
MDTNIKTATAEDIGSLLLISTAFLLTDGINVTCRCFGEIMGFHMMYSCCYLKVISEKYCKVFCTTVFIPKQH